LPTKKFEYDFLGRLTKRYGKVGSTTVDENDFGYDAASNMTSATDPAVSARNVTLYYDHANRPTKMTQNGVDTTLTYTNAELTSMTDTAGTTNYTYSGGSGAIATVDDPFNTDTVNYTYDGDGQLYQRSDPTGSSTRTLTTYTFDKADRLTDKV